MSQNSKLFIARFAGYTAANQQSTVVCTVVQAACALATAIINYQVANTSVPQGDVVGTLAAQNAAAAAFDAAEDSLIALRGFGLPVQSIFASLST